MYNINIYYGNDKPSWNPKINKNPYSEFHTEIRKLNVNGFNYPIYLTDNLFSESFCDDLVKQFNEQKTYPVGIDGYCNDESNVGSYRAMAWSLDLASIMSEKLNNVMFGNRVITSLRGHNNSLLTPLPKPNYHLLIGSTPWMRFMKYKNGGMHVPHHDCPFINEYEKYVTLFSWVLYLNTPDGTGGEFQFVNDTKNNKYFPNEWDTTDWREMSINPILNISPKCGRLLVFPHWLCHQVQQYIGNDYRYIIRGDVAFSNNDIKWTEHDK